MNHQTKIIQELFEVMKGELNVLERKVELIKKLKTTAGESWMNLRQDDEFQILARKYHSLIDDDIIAVWTRKMTRSRSEGTRRPVPLKP